LSRRVSFVFRCKGQRNPCGRDQRTFLPSSTPKQLGQFSRDLTRTPNIPFLYFSSLVLFSIFFCKCPGFAPVFSSDLLRFLRGSFSLPAPFFSSCLFPACTCVLSRAASSFDLPFRRGTSPFDLFSLVFVFFCVICR